jgi:hypothetical protein
MNNSQPLVWYGIAVIFVSTLLIIVPYLRGKSDLLTGWNILLLGMAMFMGIGCLEVRYGDWTWPQLQWFQPTRGEVQWYMAVSTVFWIFLLLGYYYNPLSKALARQRLRKWPPLGAPVYLFVLVFCGAIVALSLLTPRVTFIGPVLSNLSHKAAVFACVFSFMLWYRDRINLIWLLLFIGVFLSAALFSMVVFSGRRLLLSIFLGPVLCIYWTHARHWRPAKCMTALAMAATLILAVSAVYSTFRWFSRGPDKQERTAKSVLAQLSGLREKEGLFRGIMANKLHYFSQWSVHYSFLTKRYVDMGRLTPRPLNTLAFLATYPIPRRIWPDKPQTVGITVPHEMEGIVSTNWGVGIPGHGAYEGGVIVVILYALLIAVGIRLMDDPLRDQPGSPFLIALHAAAYPHVIAIPRGDLGIMVIETVECFVFAILVSVACRMVFGTEQRIARARLSPIQYRYPLPGRS